MADTPTSEPKTAVANDKREREGSERGRRRGGKGKGKGQGERSEGARRADGDQQAEGDRGHRGEGERRGKGGKGRDRDDKRRDRDRDRRNDQPLRAGLFAGVADRQMPCRVAGCPNTWTWYGTQQIRSLGKPEPKRMCDEHLAEFEGIEDKQMPCRNSWCTNTWLWTRAAQLYQRERQDKLKPPHRLCEQCFEEEKTTEDLQVECKIAECKNTWTWPRQAQLRHRAWVRRQQAKLDAEDSETVEASDGAESHEGESHEGEAVEAVSHESESHESESHESEAHDDDAVEAAAHDDGEAHEDAEAHEGESHEGESHEGESHEAEAEGPHKRRRRKRRRKRKIHDGPPEKLCEACFERTTHLAPIEVPCKVHGCTNTWTWERDGQLRAWAALDGRDDVTTLPQPPRRMCNSCFEFVRAHPDSEVVCGRPECNRTWTYKTGAQLQDFLAGRSQDPIRLCDECSRSQFVISSAQGVRMPPGAEVMPCQVAGCSGSWVYVPGMKLSAADPDADEPPVDRMCDDCRDQRGAPGRDPRRVLASDESTSAEASHAEAEADAGAEADAEAEADPDQAVSEPEPPASNDDDSSSG